MVMLFGVVLLFIAITLLPTAVHLTIICIGTIIRFDRGIVDFPNLVTITVVIPTRDEEVVIQSKLENVEMVFAHLNHVSVVIYDCSEDETPHIVQKFIDQRKLSKNWKIVTGCQVGKSNTVLRAIREVKSDLMIMTDADSVIGTEDVNELLRELSREGVSAVCGRNAGDHSLYRRISNWIRFSESNIGATVVFEGSICGFKMCELNEDSIDVNRNADDSQLAVSAQKKGKKAVFLRSCNFNDLDEVVDSRERKIRRAQGLIRHLGKEVKDSENSFLIRLFSGLNLHFYVIMPVSLFSIFFLSTSLSTGLFDIPFLEALNLPVLNIIAGVLLISVASGASCVYSAIFRMMTGRNLSVWQPMRESID